MELERAAGRRTRVASPAEAVALLEALPPAFDRPLWATIPALAAATRAPAPAPRPRPRLRAERGAAVRTGDGSLPRACTFMGHSTIQLTFGLYGHLMPGSEDEVGRLLESFLAPALQRSTLVELRRHGARAVDCLPGWRSVCSAGAAGRQ